MMKKNDGKDLGLNLMPVYMEMTQGSLGRLVMQFSYIHFILEVYLWRALDINPKSGRILTEDLRLASLVERFYKIVEANYPSSRHLRPLKKTTKDIDKIITQRNVLVHAFWRFPSDGPPQIFPKKGNLQSKDAPTVGEINQLVARTERITNDLLNIVDQIFPPK